MNALKPVAALAAFATAALFMVACTQQASIERNDSLMSNQPSWQKAFNEGDKELGMSVYTDDAILMPPNAKIMSGKSAIGEMFQGSDVTGVTLSLNPIEAYSSGALGFIRGEYTMTALDGATADKGKYIEVHKQVGDQWYVHRDIYNSDQPLDSHDHAADYAPAVNAYIEAWNTGAVDLMDGLFSPSAVRKTPRGTSDASNLQGFKDNVVAFRTAFPDMSITVDEVHYMDNMAVLRWSFSGTNTGPGEMEPTGAAVNISGLTTVKYLDNKVVEELVEFDTLDWMQQLGFTLTGAN